MVVYAATEGLLTFNYGNLRGRWIPICFVHDTQLRVDVLIINSAVKCFRTECIFAVQLF